MTIPLSTTTDHFHILSISRDASRTQVRAAYRKLILKHHPDKRDISTSKSFSPSGSVTPDGDYEIIRINEAYKVLSDEQLRKEYERKLDGGGVTQNTSNTQTRKDRQPTRIISLEDFEPHFDPTSEDPKEPAFYTHPCRCSAQIKITISQLEDGVDVVGCDGCGEWIGVGYDVIDEDDDRDDGDEVEINDEQAGD